MVVSGAAAFGGALAGGGTGAAQGPTTGVAGRQAITKATPEPMESGLGDALGALSTAAPDGSTTGVIASPDGSPTRVVASRGCSGTGAQDRRLVTTRVVVDGQTGPEDYVTPVTRPADELRTIPLTGFVPGADVQVTVHGPDGQVVATTTGTHTVVPTAEPGVTRPSAGSTYGAAEVSGMIAAVQAVNPDPTGLQAAELLRRHTYDLGVRDVHVGGSPDILQVVRGPGDRDPDYGDGLVDKRALAAAMYEAWRIRHEGSSAAVQLLTVRCAVRVTGTSRLCRNGHGCTVLALRASMLARTRARFVLIVTAWPA